jgi:co-chaperonin GroES (HSP10)
MIDVHVISPLVAKAIEAALSQIGCPPENRVVICSSSQKKTESGIIIPDAVEEGVCKKGVIIQYHITDEYKSYTDLIKTGVIAYYGDYAGKELDIYIPEMPKNTKLRVLSINEIMYLKQNG